MSKEIENVIEESLSPDRYCLVHNYIVSLQQKVEQLENEINRLNNIITELEKALREGSFDVYFCSTNTQKTFKSNEIIIKSLILDKLKKLKEKNEN